MPGRPVRARCVVGLATLAVVMLTAAASAHHSAAAAYEADRTIEIDGVVRAFAWTNPHCHLYVDVARGPFKGRTYTVELSSPAALTEEGWTRTRVSPGDRVVLQVQPSRSGAAAGLCRRCRMRVSGHVTKLR